MTINNKFNKALNYFILFLNAYIFFNRIMRATNSDP